MRKGNIVVLVNGDGLAFFDEVLFKNWRTEVVDDKTFRLPAGDAGVG